MFKIPGSRPGQKSILPRGSTLLFYQSSAPLGWTKITTQNDKAIRVVSGSGGVSGGTNSFSTVMAQTTVGNTTLTLSQLPTGIVSTIGNSIPVSTTGVGNQGGGGATNNTPFNSGGWSNGGPSVTSNNTSGTSHNHTITMSIQYIDVIIASKN